jgi:glutathione peroxidase
VKLKSLLKASLKRGLPLVSATLLAPLAQADASCPNFLNHEFRRLHSQETVNLCSLYQDKPLLLVNTASHCGYTKQFKGLEALYQAYKDEGFVVVGFASDDFKQAAKSEEEAATICYKNYGVSFTMLAPTPVTGAEANPVFRHLNAQTQDPAWNFNKYLITDQGQRIQHFGSKAEPQGSALEKAVNEAL